MAISSIARESDDSNPLYVEYPKVGQEAGLVPLASVEAAVRAALRQDGRTSATPTTHARKLHEQAEITTLDVPAGKRKHGALKPSIENSLKAAKTESRVNAVMASTLRGIKPDHFFVKCEAHSWGHGIGNPDSFATQCYIEKTAKGAGVPALLDSVSAVYEGKLKMELAHDSQVFRYLNATSASCGLLYDKVGFRLLKAVGEPGYKCMEKIVCGTWQIPTALTTINDFFMENPIHEQRLMFCLKGADAKMKRFLGKGAHGRVFEVRWQKKTVAMKVVADTDLAEREVGALQHAAALGASVVKVAREVTKVACGGGFFLLEPVGEPIDLKYAKTNAGKIFGALKDLHDCGMAHGDARIQNLLLVASKLLWVDFVQVPLMTQVAKQNDIRTLCKSMEVDETEFHKFLHQQ
jgi:tRNA A-37 threonylcarbamoyl transferase component Bud32